MDAPTDTIEVRDADITSMDVEAIVNAANESLLGGGGVDGAIHRAAGPALLAACRALPQVEPGVRCPTGQARITPAFHLPSRWVIHTVGPVWRGGQHGEADLLAACYASVLAIADGHGLATLAFPAISCGVYGYPPEQAVSLAVAAATRWIAQPGDGRRRIVFCCHGPAMAVLYRRVLAAA